MFDLTGKTALITGASGGIGGEIAKALHAQGATVTLTGRKKEALDALASELGERVHVVVGDLSSAEGANAVVSAAAEVMEKIDILVNNAGLTRDGLAMRMKDEDWQSVIDVNLTSCVPFVTFCDERHDEKSPWSYDQHYIRCWCNG